jgi:predicted DNA-binding transcriptional regulator AlpA
MGEAGADVERKGARVPSRALGRARRPAPTRAPSPPERMLVGVTELGELVARHVADALRPPRLLLDIQDVSLGLGVGESTIWALVKAGRMPAPLRLSTGITGRDRGRRLWAAEGLQEWVRSGCPPVRSEGGAP